MDIDKNTLKKYIIEIKFQLRRMYKEQREFIDYINQCNKSLKLNYDKINSYKADKAMVNDISILRDIKELELNNAKLEMSINETKEKSKKLLNEVKSIGSRVLDLCNTIDNNFILQEKIHLISGNTESCNEIIRFSKESDNKEPGFLDLIVHHGEYQNNKQRAKGYVDCPKWEMPLFNAIFHPMINRMKNSGISILDCPVFEQVPYFTMDSNGNLKKNKPEIVREDKNVTIVRF